MQNEALSALPRYSAERQPPRLSTGTKSAIMHIGTASTDVAQGIHHCTKVNGQSVNTYKQPPEEESSNIWKVSSGMMGR